VKKEKKPWASFPPVTPDFASLAWRLSADDLAARAAEHRAHPLTAEEEFHASHAFETEQIEHLLATTAAPVDGAHPPLEKVQCVSRRKSSDMEFWHRQELPFKSFQDQHNRENLAYAEEGAAERLYQMQGAHSARKAKEDQRKPAYRNDQGLDARKHIKPYVSSVQKASGDMKAAPEKEVATDPLLNAALALVSLGPDRLCALQDYRKSAGAMTPETQCSSGRSSARSPLTHSRVTSSCASPIYPWVPGQ